MIPSLRHADFIAVAEMPRRTAASCRGNVKSWRRMASLSTTGLLFTRVRSPALRRGKMVLLDVAASSACASGGDGVRVGASLIARRASLIGPSGACAALLAAAALPSLAPPSCIRLCRSDCGCAEVGTRCSESAPAADMQSLGHMLARGKICGHGDAPPIRRHGETQGDATGVPGPSAASIARTMGGRPPRPAPRRRARASRAA